MNLLFVLFVLYRLSTIYSGCVNKVVYEENDLYVSYHYRIYKNSTRFLSFSNIIEDFSLKGDTLVVLNREVGTFDTYVDTYVNGRHTGHFSTGSGGKYVEKGKGFYLIGTDFFVKLRADTTDVYTINLYQGHIFLDSLIAGYIGITNSFAVLKPVFSQDTVSFDTVFYETGVPFQRDFFYMDASLFFIGFDGNIYELAYEDREFLLKRLFTNQDGSFHFGSVVKGENGRNRFYLSTFGRTYVYEYTDTDSLVPLDSYDFIAVDFVGSGDTVYARSTDGIFCKIQNGNLVPLIGYPASLSRFKVDSNRIFLLQGNFPAVMDMENPLDPELSLLDTIGVRDFFYSDTILIYLSTKDSLFLLKNNVARFIDDGISPGINAYEKYLYYVKDNRVVAFDLKEFTQAASFNLQNESIFKLMVHCGRLYVISVDSSGRYLHIREMDTLLTIQSFYEIYGGGVYISPVSPDFVGNFMFIPYIRQGVNEYRVSVLDLKNNVFASEFRGHGTIEGIAAISPDTVFLLERPYGIPDVRFGIIDFGDSTFYEGDYVGVSSRKSALLSSGRFLYVYTAGRLDVFLIPKVYVSKKAPLLLLDNVLSQNVLNVYSLYNSTRGVLCEIYNIAGNRVFKRQVILEPGRNQITLDSSLSNGLFILRLKDSESQKAFHFKFVFVRQEWSSSE